MLRLSTLLLAVLASCTATGETATDKRATVDTRTDEVLARLYEESPGAKDQIADAAGYAVFSNFGVDVLFVGGGGGYGVAIDGPSGDRTYMRMGEAGVGFGLGIKDFRVIFVFENKDRLDTFIKDGWDVGVDANATAELDGQGGSLSGAASFVNGVAVYQLTETGLALRANIKGTKYWPYSELN